MRRRDFLATLASPLAGATPPNIIVIVSDDHGYADVSAYDHPKEVSTPNIDRIARRGVRFTQGYASAYVCAPTRAALMTGRYPQRFGFYTASDSRAGLPLSQTTLADVLRKRGYATGAFGKWHLGLDMPHHPMNRGFDEFYGFLGHGGHDYFDLKPTPEQFDSIWRGKEVIEDSGYLTDNLGREAAGFIERNRSKPFFAYLAFNAVHFPLQAPEATIRKYSTGGAKRDTLLAMLEHEDRAVGRVLDTLAARGLDRNTLVVFFSDNGGARNNASNNGALRDYKHSVYEGGLRVPFLMRWPGTLPEHTVFQQPVICMDVFATAAAAAGAGAPDGVTLDGRDLLPHVTGKVRGAVHDALYWDGDEDRRAVREGPWKLVVDRGRKELYNLDDDLGEKSNLALARPEIADRLETSLAKWRGANAPRIRGGGEQKREGKGGKRGKK